jgi:hypothetical protein
MKNAMKFYRYKYENNRYISTSISFFSSRPVYNEKLQRSYFPMEPGIVTPRRTVPSNIMYPEYAKTGNYYYNDNYCTIINL